MANYDVKKALTGLYGAGSSDFVHVDVPAQRFLMVDGHGDPNTSTAYSEAIAALFSASYAVRAEARTRFDRVHTVGPLEGTWSAEDMASFIVREKEKWGWTMMIVQPDWIDQECVDAALRAAGRKGLPGLERVRFDTLTEGRSVQILHVGSYDDEGPTLARLHQEFLPSNGLAPTGRHHEIYLSDPRRVEPAKRKTILRQPVAAAE